MSQLRRTAKLEYSEIRRSPVSIDYMLTYNRPRCVAHASSAKIQHGDMRLIAKLADQLLELLRGQLVEVGVVAMHPRVIDEDI